MYETNKHCLALWACINIRDSMEGLEFLCPFWEELCSNTTVNIVSIKQEIVKRNLFYLIVMATTELQYRVGSSRTVH